MELLKAKGGDFLHDEMIAEMRKRLTFTDNQWYRLAINQCIEIVEVFKPQTLAPSVPDIHGRSYCLVCGKLVRNGDIYCSGCGTKLKEDEK